MARTISADAIFPGLASDEIIPSLALSEPHGASDVANISTTATPDGDSFVLNGTKTWTSNASLADIYIVIARTGEGPGSKDCLPLSSTPTRRGSNWATKSLSPNRIRWRR